MVSLTSGPVIRVLFLVQIILVESKIEYKKYTSNLYGFLTRSRQACVCGIPNRRGRLHGGTVTAINEYPWTVALEFKGHYFCAGTIVSDRYILTAAHCIKGINVSGMTAVLGEHMRSIDLEARTRVMKIIYSVFHHEFDRATFNNDIGLVKVSHSIEYEWHIRPVCLPFPNTDYVGEFGTVTGWGKDSEDGWPTDSLHEIIVPVIPPNVCRKLGYKPNEITDNMFCGGYLAGTMDSCHGDSGGGLLWQGSDNKVDIIGIVSWGKGCGREMYPGVYTKVTNYLPWIAYHTRDSKFCGRRKPRFWDWNGIS